MAQNNQGNKLWLLFLFFIFLVIGLINLLMYTFVNQEQNDSNEFKLLLANITQETSEAIKGNNESFDKLREQKELAQSIAEKIFSDDGSVEEVIEDVESISEDMDENMLDDLLEGNLANEQGNEEAEKSLFDLWAAISSDVDVISSRQQDILSATVDIANVKSSFPDSFSVKQFQDKLISERVNPDVVASVNNQQLLFDVIGNLLNRLYDKDVNHIESLNSLTSFLLDTSNAVSSTNKQLKKESSKLYRSSDNFLRDLEDRFNLGISAPAIQVIGNLGFKASLDSGKNIQANVAKINQYDNFVSSAWYSKLLPYFPNKILNILPFLFAALSLTAYLLFNLRETSAARQQVQDKNKENQEAILQLMDELSDVADGDLTVSAMVTEGDLGVVADIINDTIERLRGLVTTVDNASRQVTTAVEQSQTQTAQLFQSTQKQSQEIERASNDVQLIANSIEKVSVSAKESANVAQRSVDIAQNGGETVHATITGMERIREQIQDTSKRIKRLGESSQEIGDIVALISDIADQTNILALNSAIQASMAGEAGRGFAVVSDEIQRLAERTTSAAKQIESLVRTIQAYTNEAVSSMEETTTEVVKGTDLAQNAGVALDEIQNVSQSLAELISGISISSGQQASSASQVSEIMKAVDNITRQTSSSTKVTADSIQNLNDLSVQLQDTVSGFQLPS